MVGTVTPIPIFEESLRVAYKKATAYSEATHYNRQIPVVTIDISKLKSGERDIFAMAPSMGNE